MGNWCEGVCEVVVDEVEGVDIVMVKLVMVFFDVFCEVCDIVSVLVWVY